MLLEKFRLISGAAYIASAEMFEFFSPVNHTGTVRPGRELIIPWRETREH